MNDERLYDAFIERAKEREENELTAPVARLEGYASLRSQLADCAQKTWQAAIEAAKGEHLLEGLDVCCDKSYDRAVDDVIAALEQAARSQGEGE